MFSLMGTWPDGLYAVVVGLLYLLSCMLLGFVFGES